MTTEPGGIGEAGSTVRSRDSERSTTIDAGATGWFQADGDPDSAAERLRRERRALRRREVQRVRLAGPELDDSALPGDRVREAGRRSRCPFDRLAQERCFLEIVEILPRGVLLDVRLCGVGDRVAGLDRDEGEQRGRFEDIVLRRPDAKANPRPKLLAIGREQGSLGRQSGPVITEGRRGKGEVEPLADGQARDAERREDVWRDGVVDPGQPGESEVLLLTRHRGVGADRSEVLRQIPCREVLTGEEAHPRRERDLGRAVGQERDAARIAFDFAPEGATW